VSSTIRGASAVPGVNDGIASLVLAVAVEELLAAALPDPAEPDPLGVTETVPEPQATRSIAVTAGMTAAIRMRGR
jgi:hypothetical protein